MSELAPSEIIDQLEQRHEKLIEELDALNARLEKALNSFVKPAKDSDTAESTGRLATVESTADGQGARTC